MNRSIAVLSIVTVVTGCTETAATPGPDASAPLVEGAEGTVVMDGMRYSGPLEIEVATLIYQHCLDPISVGVRLGSSRFAVSLGWSLRDGEVGRWATSISASGRQALGCFVDVTAYGALEALTVATLVGVPCVAEDTQPNDEYPHSPVTIEELSFRVRLTRRDTQDGGCGP